MTGTGILLGLWLLASAGPVAGGAAASFRDPIRGGAAGPVMVALPGGEVPLGENPYRVFLSPFAIARDDVTNTEFAAFLDARGDVDADGLSFLTPRSDGGLDIVAERGRHRAALGREEMPVTGVSWRGAVAYADWLSRRTGHRYALPTEAQWEHAARGGTRSVWPWGDAFDPAKANCGAGPSATPRRVGSYPANAFGLRDMVGNVWQWSSDCFPDNPRGLSRRDPANYDPACVTPSIRGGAAPNEVALCKPTFRVNYWWRGAPGTIGFRVVRLDLDKGDAG